MRKTISVTEPQHATLHLIFKLGMGGFGLAALINAAVVYRNDPGSIVKNGCFLTYWTLFSYFAVNAVEIPYMTFKAFLKNDFKSFRENDPFYITRKLCIDLALTKNVLWVALDREGIWEFHSLELPWIAGFTALLQLQNYRTPVTKENFLRDYLPLFVFLAIYAIFYGIYQGALHGTDPNGHVPYRALDWHQDGGGLALTAIYSIGLPFVMPALCQALNWAASWISDKLSKLVSIKLEIKEQSSSERPLLPSQTTKSWFCWPFSLCCQKKYKQSSVQSEFNP